ncbi:MAG: MFS transporter [Chloroflexota bacterium]
MIPASIGSGVLQPSINSLITKRVNRDEIGGMLGISSSLLSGANAIAPLIGGLIFQAFGAPAPFLLGGAILAACSSWLRSPSSPAAKKLLSPVWSAAPPAISPHQNALRTSA